jgi:hypothetical protein
VKGNTCGIMQALARSYLEFVDLGAGKVHRTLRIV